MTLTTLNQFATRSSWRKLENVLTGPTRDLAVVNTNGLGCFHSVLRPKDCLCLRTTMDDFEDVPFTLGSIRVRNRSDHSIKSTLLPVSYRPVDVKSFPAVSLQVLESSLTTGEVEGCSRSKEEKLVSDTEESDEGTDGSNDIQTDDLSRVSFSPSVRKQHGPLEALDCTEPVSPAILSQQVTSDCECIDLANKAVEDPKCNKELQSADSETTTSTTTIPDDSIEQSTDIIETKVADAAIAAGPTQRIESTESLSDGCEIHTMVGESGPEHILLEGVVSPCIVEPETQQSPSTRQVRHLPMVGASSPVFQSSIVPGPAIQVVYTDIPLPLEATGDTERQGRDCTVPVASENSTAGELHLPARTSQSKDDRIDDHASALTHTRADYARAVGDDIEVVGQVPTKAENVCSTRRGRSRSVQRHRSRSRLSEKPPQVKEKERSNEVPNFSMNSLPIKSSHSGTSSCDDTIVSTASSHRMRDRSHSRSRRRSQSHSRRAQRTGGAMPEQTKPPVTRRSSRVFESQVETNLRSAGGERDRAEMCRNATNKNNVSGRDGIQTIRGFEDYQPSRELLRSNRGVNRSRSTSSCSANVSNTKNRSQSLKQQVLVEYDFDDGFDSFRRRQSDTFLFSQSSVASARSRQVQRSKSLHQPTSVTPDMPLNNFLQPASSDASVSSASCQRRRGVRRSSSLQPRKLRDHAPVTSSTTKGLSRSASSSSLSGFIESQSAGASPVLDTPFITSSNCSITTAPDQPKRAIKRSHSLQPSDSSVRFAPQEEQSFVVGSLRRTPSVYAASTRSTNQHLEDESRSRKKGEEGLEVSPFSQFPRQASTSSSRQVPRKTKSLHVRQNGSRNGAVAAPKKNLKGTPAIQSIDQEHVKDSNTSEGEEAEVRVGKGAPLKAPSNDAAAIFAAFMPTKKVVSAADSSASSTVVSEEENTTVGSHQQRRVAPKKSFPGLKGSRLRCLIERFKQ